MESFSLSPNIRYFNLALLQTDALHGDVKILAAPHVVNPAIDAYLFLNGHLVSCEPTTLPTELALLAGVISQLDPDVVALQDIGSEEPP